ncbi:hypothetical protein HAX54_045724 [Datura stramonium]|uniref:Uncharacterized protein n=1 Tax=Datura stramonium TaxID=4076 RepID=A0ABS8WJV7_DATST|nr:hypothetical protein [Datura stramonium]
MAREGQGSYHPPRRSSASTLTREVQMESHRPFESNLVPDPHCAEEEHLSANRRSASAKPPVLTLDFFRTHQPLDAIDQWTMNQHRKNSDDLIVMAVRKGKKLLA